MKCENLFCVLRLEKEMDVHIRNAIEFQAELKVKSAEVLDIRREKASNILLYSA